MFAVIKTGGKQYRVAAGDVIAVEKLPHEAGSDIDLDQVLMIGDGASMTVGNPVIAGACVGAHVLEQTKGEKVIIFKKKRRQNYRRRRGHRQDLTLLQITEIVPAGVARKPKEARPAPKPKAAKPEAKAKPATKKEAKPAKTEAKKAKPAVKKSPAKGKSKEKK